MNFLPPADFDTRVKAVHSDPLVARALWAGLKPSTRQTYSTATKSFESFCAYHNRAPWPAPFDLLCSWIVGRAFGQDDRLIPNQGQIKPATINAYVAALRSVHVDLKLPCTDFDDEFMKRLLAGINSLFPPERPTERAPMTKDVLLRLLDPCAAVGETQLDALHLNAAMTLAFGGFLRTAEFTHSAYEEALPDFRHLKLTIGGLTISPSLDSLQLFLPRSKGDRTHKGVTILMAATNDLACPVRNVTALLQARSFAGSADPLLTFSWGGFERDHFLAAVRRRLTVIGLPALHITGHSFRRGAAQHADEAGLSRDQIQILGRWSSDAVDRYYRTSPQHLFTLQRRFAAQGEDRAQTTNNNIGA